MIQLWFSRHYEWQFVSVGVVLALGCGVVWLYCSDHYHTCWKIHCHSDIDLGFSLKQHNWHVICDWSIVSIINIFQLMYFSTKTWHWQTQSVIWESFIFKLSCSQPDHWMLFLFTISTFSELYVRNGAGNFEDVEAITKFPKVLYFFLWTSVLSLQTRYTLMKWCALWHFIWVFIVFKYTR